MNRTTHHKAAWLSRAELLAGAALVAWLQLVGLVTTQLLHHVLHALPVALLLALPKSRWVRLTSLLTGVVWIFMLAVITPMIHHSVLQGGCWHDRGMFVWLAPGAAVLSAVWAALNLTILGQYGSRGLVLCSAGFIALIPLLAAIHPPAAPFFAIPLQKALRGDALAVAALAMALVAVLAIPWTLAAVLTRRSDLRPSWTVLGWLALFWAFFLGCMLLGLLPSLNP